MTTMVAEQALLEPLAISDRPTVVLVDDDPAVLGALRRLLRKEPYDLRTTSDPRVALDWVRRDDVSLVMTDQRMPEMCGTEFVERVRRISPATVRVMLTAYPGNAQVRHGLADDVQWLVSKPWNDDALKLALRRLLQDAEGTILTSRPEGPEPRKNPVQQAFRRVSGRLAKSTGWVLGFLWMADVK